MTTSGDTPAGSATWWNESRDDKRVYCPLKTSALLTSLGCDLGGTNIKMVVLRGGRVLAEQCRPVPRSSSKEIVGAIVTLARVLIEELNGRPGARSRCARPDGVPRFGVAVPGFLDSRRRRIVKLSNLPALDGFPLAVQLERRLGNSVESPVLLDTDTNAGAYCEASAGVGRGAKRVLYLTLGTGLGAGMVISGEVVRVSRHTVGQVAHLPLEPCGFRCRCGQQGCAEATLSARGICRRARRAGLSRTQSESPEAIFLAAKSGSATARNVFRDSGVLLGKLLGMLSNLLSPDTIVVGGGLSGAGSLLLSPAAREFRKRVSPELRDNVRIQRSRFGPFAGAVGAALLAERGRETRTGWKALRAVRSP